MRGKWDSHSLYTKINSRSIKYFNIKNKTREVVKEIMEFFCFVLLFYCLGVGEELSKQDIKGIVINLPI